jgi:hypothetical protein
MSARILAVLAILSCGSTITHSLAASAEDTALRPDHLDSYTVVERDTLWSIAGRFLQYPWQWPDVWERNQHVRNPHLIYPGDVLALTRVAGRPRIYLKTASDVRLRPEVRSSPLVQAIPAIPSDAIKSFLTSPRVVTPDELKRAPYIVDFAGEHVLGGAGDRAYVRSIGDARIHSFTVYRPGVIFRDGETGEVLGYQAIFVADSRLERPGDPATLTLIRTAREALIGDRVLAAGQEISQLYFQPRAPSKFIRGSIINVLDGVSQIGQYQIVVVDRGSRDGIETGHVLTIYKSGRVARDVVSGAASATVKLPNEQAGVLMVFRPFERVSYALIMKASRALHVLDTVQTP